MTETLQDHAVHDGDTTGRCSPRQRHYRTMQSTIKTLQEHEIHDKDITGPCNPK